jgi:hypothetical protein
MRIEVRSERDSVAKDVQIYAEYRVFSVLHRFGPGIELILVNVNESGRGDETTGAECEIDVRLVDGGHAHIASAGSHAAVAIDSAVQQLARALALKMDCPPEGHAEAGIGTHKTRPKHR